MRTSPLAVLAAFALALAGPARAQGKQEADGEKVVGQWGAAYFGQRTFDFGAFGGAANGVEVHTLGVRRWLAAAPGGPVKGMGFDLGVGLGWSNAKNKVPYAGGTATLEASGFGFGLHGGLPLALARARHVTFLVVPELDLVYASGSTEAPAALPAVVKTDWSGWAFGLGARAGFELHFGFIDVPQLAVDGTLGLSFRYAETTQKPPGGDVTSSTWRLGTDRPADLVVGNVSLVYYF